ncbi:Thioredoxon-like super protein [Pseudomonas savastanoi pv. glycinea]|uniref:Thioredoxon-like super protein n=4 Tax=Pseudomonas savastanoi TaxID=29438 RepID=A0A3M3GT17_PSESG|nr:Thioredoxon-like super protein [Pseudomonas savastanoi pv. glycinea]RMQ51133.1 hypothetical protein ALQ02_04890 [Pseudomonas savastanoi pv. phaseolicola]RMM67283.1 Thioredoxon-like super protein [Pseudomonas savastanoi pv. glycinea]RMM77391.1 hypothetical protein ALQ75_01344 [Pseudomonas savastanoi pv. glycinea]RMM96445.1 hypothetical protein ALQ70_04525 [Pseudomonas savastanoi pv. glycinea]
MTSRDHARRKANQPGAPCLSRANALREEREVFARTLLVTMLGAMQSAQRVFCTTIDGSNTTMYSDVLSWGHGPRLFEVFLEPTCPFSVKAFFKLDELLAQAGEDKITVKIRLQSQPWHMFSGVIVRCILAAATLEGGKESAKAVMTAVASHREEFEFEHHASGPNMDATPNDIIARIERYSGLALADAFANPELEHTVKWHAKYARQNGIHVSPTFMIDGLVQPGLSSGDPVSKWIAEIG